MMRREGSKFRMISLRAILYKGTCLKCRHRYAAERIHTDKRSMCILYRPKPERIQRKSEYGNKQKTWQKGHARVKGQLGNSEKHAAQRL